MRQYATSNYLSTAQPQTMRDVRLAELDETGHVTYTIVPEMTVPCEIEGMVFRAEKRLEDSVALFTEAFNKKSVFETLVDIFDSATQNGQIRLHEDDLFHTLFATRMVARGTVRAELRRRPCFQGVGEGWWQFEPGQVCAQPIETFETQRRTSGRSTAVLSPEQHLAAVEAHFVDLLPDQLTMILRRFRDPFDEFVRTVEKLYFRTHLIPETEKPSELTTDTVTLARQCILELRHRPDDREANRNLAALLDDMFNLAAENYPADSPSLQAVLASVPSHIWESCVRPKVDEAVKRCLGKHQYGAASLFYTLDATLSGQDRKTDIAKIERRGQAHTLYVTSSTAPTPQVTMRLLAQALDIDPSLKEAQITYAREFNTFCSIELDEVRKSSGQGAYTVATERWLGALQFCDTFKKYLDQPNTAFNDTDKVGVELIGILLAHVQNDYAHNLYVNVTRIFQGLKGHAAQEKCYSAYCTALAIIGTMYCETQHWAEASIILRHALDIAKQTRVTPDTLIKARRAFVEACQELDLWDWAEPKIRDLLSNLGRAPSAEEKAQLAQAVMYRSDSPRLTAAHTRYRTRLQTMGVIDGINPGYLAALLQKEKEWHMY